MTRLIILLIIGTICISCTIRENKFLESENAYFGLRPPGMIPEVFAPGIVSDTSWAEHCQLAVSADGKEIYWSVWTADYKTEDSSRNTEQIFYSKFENGIWTKPKLAEFIKDNPFGLNGGPTFSLDGEKLFFNQVKSPWVSSDMNTYYVEKVNGIWSDDPVNVGLPYNTDSQNYSPTFTLSGNAYKSERGRITKFTYSNGVFAFTDTIVIHKDFRPAWNIYVSPSEDYMIFAAMHKEGFGDIDLYISFKTHEDKWGRPKNMGDKINTELRERFPTVSPDGKYLFFMRHTETQDIFWVSADVINELQE